MRLFQTVKVIRSRKGDLHFRRWALVESDPFSIYLHFVYRADEDIALHNHPWEWCWSMILYGGYYEKRATHEMMNSKMVTSIHSYRGIRGPLSTLKMKPQHYHAIRGLYKKVSVSLFLAGKRTPSWGYLITDKRVKVENTDDWYYLDDDVKYSHMDHEKYRILKRSREVGI